jgi:hypothetical protein
MTAGQEQLLALILTALGVVFIPMFIALIRVIRKWTIVEMRLEALAGDMHELVESKDKVHTEMFKQLSEDRAATDKRLRWLEENLWKRGSRPNAL